MVEIRAPRPDGPGVGMHGKIRAGSTPGPMSQQPESPAPPPWVGWIQMGLSTMLAVLFLVVLTRSLEQGRALRQLQMRLETLESSRNLEKAADQNSQLRILTQRLQALETQVGERIERSESERLRLQQLLSDLRSRMTPARALSEEDADSSPAPRPKPVAGSTAPMPQPSPAAALPPGP